VNPPLAHRFRLLASVVSVLIVLGALAAGWLYFQLRASLPQLDGSAALPGLTARVTVDRDALGVPTVRGATRADVARALGFLHAQDRFFQMDLLRRRGAGELAELFGEAALPLDRQNRVHGFRALSRQVLTRLPPDRRTLLERYAAGVNAGLAALRQKPFEYLVLRAAPQPWLPEDSLLVIYAMTLDVQDSTGRYERSLTAVRDRFGNQALDFFAPLVTPDDAALDGTTAALAPIPSARVIDLRNQPVARAPAAALPAAPAFAYAGSRASGVVPGSNSFALIGAHTASGGPLLANDPHLDLRVPNIWYRAVLEWNGGTSAHRIVGATLPGLPFVVIGSNGHIAWGLTATYADTGDIVAVEVNAVAPSLYAIPGQDGLTAIEQRHSLIRVKGGDPVTLETSWTHWGPVVGADDKQRPLAYHWIAYDPAATDLEFIRLETATTAAEAVDIAHHTGIPAQNFLVADDTGHIAWTIIGHLPKRVGFDGRLPTSWSYGDRRWDGFLPPGEVPVLTSPVRGNSAAPAAARDGRLWTANNRLLGGTALARLGDGGYSTPPRAAQIRDDLAKLEHATPQDLLGIQLDDRAAFLDRWQKLLLVVLPPGVVAQKKSRAELRRLAASWEGRARADSVSYRLVRAFRENTIALVFPPIFASCKEAMPDFDWSRFNLEPALWTMVREKPAHLLNPEFKTWDALLLAAADAVIADLDRQNTPLAHATWGRRNTARIRHPLSRAFPRWLTGWLDLPADPLPGDVNMPRVQTPSFGASLRLVVSPGREAEGIFEMPGGESGHPLSPFYRAGHEAWVRGEPAPLLPGKTQHTLTLRP
jgi:penicillin amidase